MLSNYFYERVPPSVIDCTAIETSQMQKVTLENYTTDKYYAKIVKAVESVLRSENFVTPIDVFMSIGLLEKNNIDDWRRGRISYLEKAIKCNLAKASRILRILRFHAHDLNLKPSVTAYQRKIHGRKIPLRFSKSGERSIEEAYSRHFVKLGKSTHNNVLKTDPSAVARCHAD